jgi:transposase InsO family protein
MQQWATLARMIDFLNLLGRSLIGLFRSHVAREAEMAFLRQQLLVLKRSAPTRLRLRTADRLIFVWLYRRFPSLLGAAVIFKPETLVRWHRSGFRLYWRWKSRRRVGRPAVPNDIRDLVRTISRDNPLWGAPRIHGELLKLGIDIAQSSVAKYMPRRRGSPSPGWRAFLRNHTGHIAAVDLFVVPTIGFKLLYGLVILRLERRRLVWTSVTTNPTAEWIARQVTEAFPWDEAPRYLIRDRDTSYGAAVTRRLRAMGIRDRPITPRSPWQNGHVERLIGSIRRECLDHVVVFGERHLRELLANYATYYNAARTHLALDKDAPLYRPTQTVGRIASVSWLGGLHQQYVRMA